MSKLDPPIPYIPPRVVHPFIRPGLLGPDRLRRCFQWSLGEVQRDTDAPSDQPSDLERDDDVDTQSAVLPFPD